MARRKTQPTDPLTPSEEAFLRLIHAGKTNDAAVKEVWPGRYKRAAAKGSKLRNDPRAKTFLAALREADSMRVRRIVEEKGCGYEARIAVLAEQFMAQQGNPKGATALVKIHDKLSQAEGRTEEKRGGARTLYLTYVHGQKRSGDESDSLKLPELLGRVCEDPDEEQGATATYLQPHPEGPGRPPN